MLTESKSTIIKYLEDEPASSTREVSQGSVIQRSEAYKLLCELERKGLIMRRGGLDGNTITFKWSLVD